MKAMVREEIEVYARTHSTPANPLLEELEKATREMMKDAQMLTGPVEAGLLKLLVGNTHAKRVIEVGMFTGYGTLSMAEALPEDGKIIACEVDPERIQFAKKYFERSPHGRKIEVWEGNAYQTMRSLVPPYDLIFIDAEKTGYDAYYEEAIRLLRVGGLVVLDNMLMAGKVLEPNDPESKAVDALNRKISHDKRVEAVLLTIRDGVVVGRKKN
ncbi:MAG: class I SAM-dependent methyltransferase [Pseudomonadota bacterium]